MLSFSTSKPCCLERVLGEASKLEALDMKFFVRIVFVRATEHFGQLDESGHRRIRSLNDDFHGEPSRLYDVDQFVPRESASGVNDLKEVCLTLTEKPAESSSRFQCSRPQSSTHRDSVLWL